MLCTPQSSSITGTSPSDYLVSYPGLSLWGSYPPAEVQLVYSTVPADWASFYNSHNLHIRTMTNTFHQDLVYILQTGEKIDAFTSWVGRHTSLYNSQHTSSSCDAPTPVPSNHSWQFSLAFTQILQQNKKSN